jgi:hypothetical protein
MKRHVTAVVVIIVALTIQGLTLAQNNPRIGTWKLNIEKSHFDGPPPKSRTVTYEAAGKNGQKCTVAEIDAKGHSTGGGYTAQFDGKDYPVIGFGPNVTIAVEQIDAHTAKFTAKVAGKVVSIGTGVVSDDGKLFTITQEGPNASGHSTITVDVYDRQ